MTRKKSTGPAAVAGTALWGHGRPECLERRGAVSPVGGGERIRPGRSGTA